MASFTYAKWAEGKGGRTGFRIGGFVTGWERLLERLEGTKADKMDRFERLCMEMFNRIIARTPVDTGLAQSSWTFNVEERTDDSILIAIRNPVFYVIYLEYGHSKQAPQGMVRITLEEMRQEVKSI
jgi:hypothetical protein